MMTHMDYFKATYRAQYYADLLERPFFSLLLKQREGVIKEQWRSLSLSKPLLALSQLSPSLRAKSWHISHDHVVFEPQLDPQDPAFPVLRTILESFIPWRLGPWNYLGIEVDGEWQSYYKWQRLDAVMPSLHGALVADIGANSGYFMYRLLNRGVQEVVGFDPIPLHYLHFLFHQMLLPQKNMHFENLGVDDLVYERFFDLVLYLGVFYHRRSPLSGLEKIYQSLKPGGELYIETMGLDMDGPYLYFPQTPYMAGSSYWFIPSVLALQHMLRRVGFKDDQVIDISPSNTLEQRRTIWSPFWSLEDFLDPDDPQKTREGHRAPVRLLLRARKP